MGGRRQSDSHSRCGAGTASQCGFSARTVTSLRSSHSRLRKSTKAALHITPLRRAQASMEYLMVMAFVFALLVAILAIAYQQSTTFSSDVTAAQIQKVGNEIADAANTVYYAGPPTKKTIKLYFPDGIRSILIDEQRIIFTVQGSSGEYEYVVWASTNMTGTLQSFAGVHTITVEAQDDEVSVLG